MTRAEIIEMVKARLDELTPASLSTSELNSAIDLIEKTLDESAIAILLMYPLYLLPVSDITGAQSINSDLYGRSTDGVGTIKCALDFLRLHTFLMEEWLRPVSDVITEDSPKYKLQWNTITRGGIAKPVVVLSKNTAGNLVLMYVSVPLGSAHTVTIKRYVPETLPEDLPDVLINGLAWHCAASVLQILSEDMEAAKLAMGKVYEDIKNHERR